MQWISRSRHTGALCKCAAMHAVAHVALAARDLTRPTSHAQLEEGSAEVFGAELQRGVSINVVGQKLAVSVDSGAFSHVVMSQ